ncbi:hypothetical protein BV20DRAFT_1052896 [Pilatotrama ljubarskyi]|nr:hypothetical protein BV20DRAFT_1052896 [Pilatotrama ljubarskyi]
MGAMNFTRADTRELLRLIREHMPVGEMGWHRVAAGYAAYASKHGRPKRGVRSLRLKYYRLVNTKKPTGDPHCPEEVREAKCLERRIESRMLMTSMNDAEDEKPIPAEWEEDKDAQPESDDSDMPPEDDEVGADMGSSDGDANGSEGQVSGEESAGEDGCEEEELEGAPPCKRRKVEDTAPDTSKQSTLIPRCGQLVRLIGKRLEPAVSASSCSY